MQFAEIFGTHIVQLIKTQKLSYYTGIMLDALTCLLSSKLCRHNWCKPKKGTNHVSLPVPGYTSTYIMSTWPWNTQKLIRKF